MSSQMVYPLLPAFLLSLGAPVAIIGLIEGIAEATASVSRVFFGRMADRWGKRKIFIWWGYAGSALARPLLYLVTAWPQVLAIRFTDRMGKASRNPARDALLAESVDAAQQGAAFGMQRAMDRVGALLGPMLAMLVLYFYPGELRWVFVLSVIPGLIALVFLPGVRETPIRAADTTHGSKGLRSREFRFFLIGNFFFALGNGSQAFFLIKALEVEIDLFLIPGLWMVFNAVAALSSPILGKWSDRLGKKPVLVLSMLVFSLVNILFGWAGSDWQIWLLFAAFGIYYGLSRGVSRAYIAELVPSEKRATAYGIFHTVTGLALFPASLIMGLLWDSYGSAWAFGYSALMALLGLIVWTVASGIYVKYRNS